jgi:uncharacterized membrane protein YdfJ with MMPL/SSD domain
MARARWGVLGASAVLALLGGLWGMGVFGTLSSGGFDTPHSESARARDRILAEVGYREPDLLVLYSSDRWTVDDAPFRAAVTATLARVRSRSEVVRVVSYYDIRKPAFVSRDAHATYAAVTLATAGSTGQLDAIRDQLVAPGLHTQIGGPTAIFSDVNRQVKQDLALAEGLSIPILLGLLVVVFRSVIAATTPLVVGGLAILGAFTAIRALTILTPVSVFAINIITLLSMGMAIDYALFIVSRFREELAVGQAVPRAISRTVATAGRTVAFSGLIVTLALASLLLFPQMFLRSMGVGGVIAVLVAMLTALTVLPALLAVLGHRVNALRLPLGRRTTDHYAKGAPGVERATGGGWARLGHAVLRRPVLVVVSSIAALAVLASPFLHARFGGVDERVLPADRQSRVVSQRLHADFPGGAESLSVLVSNADAAAAAGFADRVGRLSGVAGAAITAASGSSFVVSVSYVGASGGPSARRVVAEVRSAPRPTGAQVLVGGSAADATDLLASLGARLPWMALLSAAATMLLLFLAFGSLVLPIKALVMSVVSVIASFGVIVWGFQDGHLAAVLGFTSTGYLEATQLILMLAILVGLSTDYEVFLLARIREEWERTGDNTVAVVNGLARTGQIITSAALLLAVVVAGFAAGGITFIKMIGVGMIVAVLVDATVVRTLLAPALMRLLGAANWWAPAPLARMHRRCGLPEPLPARPDDSHTTMPASAG